MTDSRKPRSNRDLIEHTIEVALNPGSFISDRACFSFVSDLRELSTTIAKLVEAEPLRAVEVHETFLAGCYEKAEEIDDSSGSFGQFVGELHCAWITARQAAAAPADETAVRLLAWMDDDPYGFCHQLEKDAAKVLDKAGRAALEKLIRARFDAGATEKPMPGGSFRSDPDYQRRRCGEILRALYTAQRNVEAYVALAEATECTPQDCHTLATLLMARRKPGEALSWVKRGMALAKKTARGSMAGYQLARFLNAKKSKYYDSALENFERAKRCYQRAGLTADWAKIVSRVRESHHRKMGFMSGFESLVAGSGPSRAPSFLERAKTTWGARQPRHGP